jgi:hypothetical protein
MIKRFALAALGLSTFVGCQGMTEPPPPDEKKAALVQPTSQDEIIRVAGADHAAAD